MSVAMGAELFWASTMWTKSALIVDIDNTVFDWTHFWKEAFGALVESVLESSPGLDRQRLLDEIRSVHQRVGTSEYAFILQDLRPLLLTFGFDAAAEKRAVQAYRDARSVTLQLYPEVSRTLRSVKARGARIIAFTESRSYHTMYRVSAFGLDGVLDAVYSPPDHVIPSEIDVASVRSRDPASYRLKYTRHEIVPTGFTKPDPEVLKTILEREGLAARDAVYVGDSLDRDIAMAQAAGVLDALAEYGHPTSTASIDLLLAVTHRGDEEIASSRPRTTPTISLFQSIAELNDWICFERSILDDRRRYS